MVGVVGFGGPTGSCPSPFDALEGHFLAGPEGSHPLHGIDASMLLRPARPPIGGSIDLDAPSVRVGEQVTGIIRLRPTEGFDGRRAAFRLVGLCLVEERKSASERDSHGRTHFDSWVAANGSLFAIQTFDETVIPVRLAPGQVWESSFRIPAPSVGPPSAHLGEAIVAWALEVRWDLAWHEDPVLATLLEVRQGLDLLRAGVGNQGDQALVESVELDGATIAVTSRLPAPTGAPLEIVASWPSAPNGRGARVELHRRTSCPNGVDGIVASTQIDLDTLRAGAARASLALTEGMAPSFDGVGLQVSYVLRILVDRERGGDVAIERLVGIA